jgi:hypothetical protein
MLKREEKRCPRCNITSQCKIADIKNCQNIAVNISNKTKEFLNIAVYNYLCQKCLTEIDNLVYLSENQSFPKQSQLLIEGLHYYIENKYFVFTEFYHLLRGNCCKSGCRHCAYGYEK